MSLHASRYKHTGYIYSGWHLPGFVLEQLLCAYCVLHAAPTCGTYVGVLRYSPGEGDIAGPETLRGFLGCTAGADINALGFVFLRTPQSALLTNVTYAGLPTNQVTHPPAGPATAFTTRLTTLCQTHMCHMPEPSLGQISLGQVCNVRVSASVGGFD